LPATTQLSEHIRSTEIGAGVPRRNASYMNAMVNGILVDEDDHFLRV
jgi:hypothetical protein